SDARCKKRDRVEEPVEDATGHNSNRYSGKPGIHGAFFSCPDARPTAAEMLPLVSRVCQCRVLVQVIGDTFGVSPWTENSFDFKKQKHLLKRKAQAKQNDERKPEKTRAHAETRQACYSQV